MIFLLNGKARSGKDTVADYIVSKTGAKKLWYAKPLKDFSIKYFNLSEDECYEHKTELSRRILQGVGEMFRDEIDKNFWVSQTIKQISTFKKEGFEHFVISDCRYRNEIIEMCTSFDNPKLNKIIESTPEDDWKKYLTDYGYQDKYTYYGDYTPINCHTISIKRENCPQIEYGQNHASENDLNNFLFDCYISNNGTLDDLYKKVDSLMEQLGVKFDR